MTRGKKRELRYVEMGKKEGEEGSKKERSYKRKEKERRV